MLFFSIERWARITFYNLYNTQKKNTKIHRIKSPKNMLSPTDYKNYDISILQINQIIFYLSRVTIFRTFELSHATV